MNNFDHLRNSWNITMPLHQKVRKAYYDKAFESRIFSSLHPTDMDVFINKLDISGKMIAHLCCNNGVELMSLLNLGAKKCVGFDLCDEAIKEAKTRCNELNYPIDFYRTNIYDISDQFNNTFDIIYLSVGSLRWLPDISGLYDICYRLLRDGGFIFISDTHPLAEIVNDDRDASVNPLEITYQFDRKDCLVDNGSLDYVGRTRDHIVKRIWYIHSFTNIIGLLVAKNFLIRYFNESTEDTAGVYELLRSLDVKIPLSFQLIAEKG